MPLISSLLTTLTFHALSTSLTLIPLLIPLSHRIPLLIFFLSHTLTNQLFISLFLLYPVVKWVRGGIAHELSFHFTGLLCRSLIFLSLIALAILSYPYIAPYLHIQLWDYIPDAQHDTWIVMFQVGLFLQMLVSTLASYVHATTLIIKPHRRLSFTKYFVLSFAPCCLVMYGAFIASQWMSRFFIWAATRDVFRGSGIGGTVIAAEIGAAVGGMQNDSLSSTGIWNFLSGTLHNLLRATNLTTIASSSSSQQHPHSPLLTVLELQIKPLIIIAFHITMRSLKSLFIFIAKRIDVSVCDANYKVLSRTRVGYGEVGRVPVRDEADTVSVNGWLSERPSEATPLVSRMRSSSINAGGMLNVPQSAAIQGILGTASSVRSTDKLPGTPSRRAASLPHTLKNHLTHPNIPVSSVAHFCHDEIRFEKFEDKNQILTFRHDHHEHHQSSLIPVASFMMDLFYYIYYRLIFTTINSWEVFAVTHSLHLVMEVGYHVVICSYTWFRLKSHLSKMLRRLRNCLCCCCWRSPPSGQRRGCCSWWRNTSMSMNSLRSSDDVLEYDVAGGDSPLSSDSDIPFHAHDEDFARDTDNRTNNTDDSVAKLKREKRHADYLFYRASTMTIMSLSVHAQLLSVALFITSGLTLQFCTPGNIAFYHAPRFWRVDRMLIFPCIALVTEICALVLIRVLHRVLYSVKSKEWFLGAKLLSNERLFFSLIVVVLHVAQDVFVSRIELEI